MKLRSSVSIMFAGLIAAATFTFAGCSESATVTPVAEDVESAEPAGDEDAASSHQHGVWWCGAHGVPEEECARCDKSLVAKFKAAGDWCEQDNRPDSQCFVCHPENFEKFASLYEAKHGERPKMPVE